MLKGNISFKNISKLIFTEILSDEPHLVHTILIQKNIVHHYNNELKNLSFKKGDYLVSTKQNGVKYLLETLEPEAVDSFFNWNFFDTILQQKEGYSDYVFEDLAAEILQENPNLKLELAQKVKDDKAFAENPDAQLDWVYKHSIYYEKAHLQYPVYRIMY